jgi:predicted secreted protein
MNTKLYLGSDWESPITFGATPIANVGDYAGPSMSAAIVDVTSHSNVDAWRQKITTLLDGGDLTLPCFFIPSDTDHKALLAVFTARERRQYKLVFPDTGATTWYFDAFVSKFSFTEPVAGVVTASVTFTLTGAPTLA